MQTKRFQVVKHIIEKQELETMVNTYFKEKAELDIEFEVTSHPQDEKFFIVTPKVENPLDYPEVIDQIKDKGFFTPGTDSFTSQLISLLFNVDKPTVEHTIIHPETSGFTVVIDIWSEMEV